MKKQIDGEKELRYEAPLIFVIEIIGEGVLCSSDGFDNDNFTEIFDREDMEDL